MARLRNTATKSSQTFKQENNCLKQIVLNKYRYLFGLTTLVYILPEKYVQCLCTFFKMFHGPSLHAHFPNKVLHIPSFKCCGAVPFLIRSGSGSKYFFHRLRLQVFFSPAPAPIKQTVFNYKIFFKLNSFLTRNMSFIYKQCCGAGARLFSWSQSR